MAKGAAVLDSKHGEPQAISSPAPFSPGACRRSMIRAIYGNVIEVDFKGGTDG
jgi:hypothetical protein